jgi:hypothetical protein
MRKWLPILALLAGIGSSFSYGQGGIVDCVEPKKIAVSRIQGQVFDTSGAVVPGATVSVTLDGKVKTLATAGANGEFRFKFDSGHYVLRVSSQGFQATEAELEVGGDVFSLLRRTVLRVILAVPGNNCPWVAVSNREFKEIIHNYATQK